ncbi:MULTISPECIES: hypothetical protein [Micromonospora]|uniref:hypothetical protein n=1 Tax=Micromonospora TaxID=1873 RepID=UPI001EE870EA|nr:MULTISPECIES: hypothetical protein [Micromonospora]MCG5451054.1 hypothetical protein [Micromonospora hortensis]MCX5120874.1 hypothetical protein [Micromonospora sp. NBC_00362]WTI07129.1 hypothetical protein OHB44_27620 [Micromonospora sp. NBC_00821]
MQAIRTINRALSSALTLVGLVGAFVLLSVAPARAGENVFVEVTPNSAQAGSRVSIKASCDNDNNNRQSSVHSDAFGHVQLKPDKGFLTAQVTIARDKPAGDYPVDLRCENGQTSSTTLTVLNMASPSKGPATGGGGMAGGRGAGSLLVLGGVALVATAIVLGMAGGRRRPGAGS